MGPFRFCVAPIAPILGLPLPYGVLSPLLAPGLRIGGGVISASSDVGVGQPINGLEGCALPQRLQGRREAAPPHKICYFCRWKLHILLHITRCL